MTDKQTKQGKSQTLAEVKTKLHWRLIYNYKVLTYKKCFVFCCVCFFLKIRHVSMYRGSTLISQHASSVVGDADSAQLVLQRCYLCVQHDKRRSEDSIAVFPMIPLPFYCQPHRHSEQDVLYCCPFNSS